MSAFINGTGAVTAQSTFVGDPLSTTFNIPQGNRWSAIEPDYAALIDSRQIRRMSRVIRMGMVAARKSVQEAGLEMPGAVVVGTALGCMEDTNSFLTKMVEHGEDLLSPTAFIHSTHNTIAAQIALQYGCRGYNSTYVHRSISFESALADSLMLLEEGAADSVVTGGIDEIIDTSFIIMERLGHFKKPDAVQAGGFYSSTDNGSVAGEGSVFLTLSKNQVPGSYARITSVETCSFSGMDVAVQAARRMLAQHGLPAPDLLLSGLNGDSANDARHQEFAKSIGASDKLFPFKHWCGEYATATAFATWMAAHILRLGSIPGNWKQEKDVPGKIQSVLIHNNSVEAHHSIVLLNAC